MNKPQKILISITLLLMACLLIYAPITEIGPRDTILSAKRGFLFSLPKSEQQFWTYQIDIRKLIIEQFAVVLFALALLIIQGLTKKQKGKKEQNKEFSHTQGRKEKPQKGSNPKEETDKNGFCCSQLQSYVQDGYIEKRRIFYSGKEGVNHSNSKCYFVRVTAYKDNISSSTSLPLLFCPFCGKEFK